jgi:enoyl-CoA hydratase/carnithine racemase
MADRLVKLERQGAIAIISLNRPARHNALVPELLSDLLAALEDDDCLDASAVVLRAEGLSFSTGGDLLRFQQNRDTIGEYAHELVGLLNRSILALYSHPVPIVCAVQGHVTGGSLGLLLASDRIVMRRGATITPWYTEVGFSPDGGWTALLPDIAGRQQTLQWLASNASRDADSCLMLGLVHQVVDKDCDTAAMVWAERVAVTQSGSITRNHRLLNTNIEELRYRLEAEREAFVTQVQTQQALDGIDKFLRRQ